MHPLDGPRRKLDRAAEHIQTLNDAVKRWYDSKPVHVIAKHFNADETAYIYRFEYPAIPVFFGIVAGDIFHNLRSALDHLAWQLALLTKLAPYEHTAFPICLTNTSKTRLHFKRLLQDVPDDARQAIESLQPYNTPNGIKPENHGLWILDQLSNFDKHRIITLGAAITEIEFKAGMRQDWLDDHTIEISIPVVDKNFPPPPPESAYYLVVGHDIVGSGMQLAAIPVLHKFVRDVVLPKFERFFPE